MNVSREVKISHDHNHNADVAKFQRNITMHELRTRAKETKEATHFIISNITAKGSDETNISLPTERGLQQTIRRRRYVETNRKIEFTDFRLSLQKTSRDEQFLIHDSGYTEQEKIVLFTSGSHLLIQNANFYK